MTDCRSYTVQPPPAPATAASRCHLCLGDQLQPRGVLTAVSPPGTGSAHLPRLSRSCPKSLANETLTEACPGTLVKMASLPTQAASSLLPLLRTVHTLTEGTPDLFARVRLPGTQKVSSMKVRLSPCCSLLDLRAQGVPARHTALS